MVCWQFPEDYIRLLYCHVQGAQRYKAILERDESISSRLKVFKLLPVLCEITETKSFTLFYYLDSSSNKMQAQDLN